MFEVEVSRIDPFRNLVKALSVIVEEGTFTMNEAQLKLLAMDPSHVAMVDFELPSEFFDSYKCEGEPKLSINIKEFLRFLDRVERDEQVRIVLNKEKARLVIHCKRGGHSRRFEMPILEPLDEEVPQPKIFFKAKARLTTAALRMAIRDANLVSEHVRVEVDADLFKINAEGDMGASFSEWEADSDDLLELKVEEVSNATFTLSYLQDIANAAGGVSEVATLELSTDMPIKMDFEIPQGRLIYYLAPCIGV
ncbi:MAG: proliferating cell nuclear antigen (pcna) [Candidatus Bathyarchaeota archaeon]|nr:proliferating cell nuclear antigen (pcna) [Candidatus Bathyarchaeota archaeon]